MLPIIDRYILKEVTRSFLAIIIVLMLIVVSQSYIKILEDAAAGVITDQVVMRLLGLEVLQVLGPVIPPTFFFAILYSLGRMYRDSEMTAFASGGIGVLRIFRPFLLISLPIALLVAWLTLDLIPWVNENKTLIEQSQGDSTAELGAAVAGRFNESSRGNLVFYVQEMSEDNRRLRNVFVQDRQNQTLGLVAAREGYQYFDETTGEHYLVLLRGHQYQGTPGQGDYSIGDFDKYSILMDRKDKVQKELPPKALPTAHLMESDLIRDKAELHYRLMFPVAVVVFAIVSLPLSKSMPRDGIYGRLMLSILFYFVFLNLQAVSGDWMIKGVTPEWMGRWWVHPFMLFLGGMVMLLKSERQLGKAISRMPRLRGGKA
jgi:lipopolysaccharide export system permease protein